MPKEGRECDSPEDGQRKTVQAMFYTLVYAIGGIYLLLMSFNVLHGAYMRDWNPPRRTALRVIAGGLLILASYYGWLTWFLSTPEGKQHQEMQLRMQRQTNEP